MNLDDVVAKVCYNLSEAGLREQIEIDRRAIAREWARQHVASGIDLKRWCEEAGIPGGMWFEKQAAGGEE